MKIYFIPFYGIIGLALLFLENIYTKFKINFYVSGLLNGIAITFIELLGGVFCIIFFGQNLWDYSKHFLNFYGIISFPVFLVWLLLGSIFSLVYRLLKKINKKPL